MGVCWQLRLRVLPLPILQNNELEIASALTSVEGRINSMEALAVGGPVGYASTACAGQAHGGAPSSAECVDD